MSKWPVRYDLLLRLRFIEVVALWEGRVNTTHLTSHFGIKRAQASKDLGTYRNEIAPNNLEYDSKIKAYIAHTNFSPKLTNGTADEYLHLLMRNRDLNQTFELLDLGFSHCHQLPIPNRAIKPDVLRPIIHAIRENRRLEVDYRSVNDPQPGGRVIAPHSIIYASNRWHVRAYCEKNREFRDFVLTRFFSAPEFEEGKSDQFERFDENWNTELNIVFAPDNRLSKEQQEVIEQDFGMTDGKLLITVRASLVAYLLRELRIDAHTIHADPKAQQIIVENLDQIKHWVFG